MSDQTKGRLVATAFVIATGLLVAIISGRLVP